MVTLRIQEDYMREIGRNLVQTQYFENEDLRPKKVK